MKQLNALVEVLEDHPEGPLFNPWFQTDSENDVMKDAPVIRREQLCTYLEQRIDQAQFLFIAEAVGYQGGHFSGIAMTSERILLGHHQKTHGIAPEQVFKNRKPQRTSKPAINKYGMTEPTATIMWKALNALEINPYYTVLWNAVPWHPYNHEKGMLSNRTPTTDELKTGHKALRIFLKLFDRAVVIAVGRKAEQSLLSLGIKHKHVRHPANGGAPKFRCQLKEIVNQTEQIYA